MKKTHTTDTEGIKFHDFHADTAAPQLCPCCGKGLDAVTTTAEEGPQKGDISICAYCGTFLYFENSDYFRKLEDSELETMKTAEPERHRFLTRIRDQFMARSKSGAASARTTAARFIKRGPNG